MKDAISYGTLTAAPGNRAAGFAEVLDTGYAFPVTVINGAREGKTLLLTAGIHGGEYPGILTAMELARELDPADLSGQVVIIHPVNVSAFYAQVPYIFPEDGKNLNRLFPGNPDGTLGDKIAHVLTTEYQDRADFYVDLHGGDLPASLTPYVYYPGVGDNREALETARQAALALDMRYRVKSGATTGAYNSCAVRGTPSLLLERGGRGLWERSEVEAYKEDIRQVMRFLGILPGGVREKTNPGVEITRAVYLNATETGCWFPFARAEERVKKGRKLGEIRDFFGNLLAEYHAEFDGMVLFVTVRLPVRRDEPVITYGV